MKKRPLAMLCTNAPKNRRAKSRARSGQQKGGDSKAERRIKNGKSLPACHSMGESSAPDQSTLLRRRSEEKLPRGSTITMKQVLKRRPPSNLGIPAESEKIASNLLPEHSPLGGAHVTQIIKPPQHPVGTPKPMDNNLQPADNQPRGQQTIRIHGIHRNHSAPKTLLSPLPTSITQ